MKTIGTVQVKFQAQLKKDYYGNNDHLKGVIFDVIDFVNGGSIVNAVCGRELNGEYVFTTVRVSDLALVNA